MSEKVIWEASQQLTHSGTRLLNPGRKDFSIIGKAVFSNSLNAIVLLGISISANITRLKRVKTRL